MSALAEESWQDFVEAAERKLTCRVREAEAVLAEAECDSNWMDRWFEEDPRRTGRYFGDPDERKSLENLYRKGCLVERAAYGWRRDYGEWPSFLNLIERLAVEAGISHRAARVRIERDVNDPSPDHHLHIIRADHLTAILNDEPHTGGPWVRYEDHVRFYVDPAGQEWLASRYDLLARLAAA